VSFLISDVGVEIVLNEGKLVNLHFSISDGPVSLFLGEAKGFQVKKRARKSWIERVDIMEFNSF